MRQLILKNYDRFILNLNVFAPAGGGRISFDALCNKFSVFPFGEHCAHTFFKTEHLLHRCWRSAICKTSIHKCPDLQTAACGLQHLQSNNQGKEQPDIWPRNSGIREGGRHQPAPTQWQGQAARLASMQSRQA